MIGLRSRLSSGRVLGAEPRTYSYDAGGSDARQCLIITAYTREMRWSPRPAEGRARTKPEASQKKIEHVKLETS